MIYHGKCKTCQSVWYTYFVIYHRWRNNAMANNHSKPLKTIILKLQCFFNVNIILSFPSHIRNIKQYFLIFVRYEYYYIHIVLYKNTTFATKECRRWINTPTGAWKWNFPPLKEIIADRATDQPTDRRTEKILNQSTPVGCFTSCSLFFWHIMYFPGNRFGYNSAYGRSKSSSGFGFNLGAGLNISYQHGQSWFKTSAPIGAWESNFPPI